MAHNIAAWLPGVGEAIEVGPTDLPIPGPGELLIKVSLVAVQPVEYKIQKAILSIPLTYPAILGFTFTGVVVKTGPGVIRFNVGDRIVTNGAGPFIDDARFGGYQRYALTTQALTSKIGNVSFETAASVSNLYTAASALVLHLGLDRPAKEPRITSKGQKVLIWGASSSLGVRATQMAVDAGYTVVGTASLRNEGLVKSFGAEHFVDRKSVDTAQQLIRLGPFQAILAAADSAEDQPVIGRVLAAQGGGSFLSTMGLRDGVTLPPGVQVKFAQFLDDYLDPKNKGFTEWLWWDYLENTLQSNKIKPLPLNIIGGLSKLQAALDLLSQGSVSATRLAIDASLD
ncbi:putative alcohol dehydrogenase [Xylariales sp. PMI_506]|nr:putative alcohol dehydrogenase [Xylariales sp. PMI_506]